MAMIDPTTSWRIFVVLLLGAALRAQTPPAWTVDEATAAALLPLFALGDPVPTTAKAGGPEQPFVNYAWTRCTVPPTAGEGFVAYAWPRQGGVRTLGITDRGVLMVTTDRTRPYGTEECVPAWSALVAKGSAERLDQALDMPGRGLDDQMWQPVAMAKPTTTRLMVRGVDGTPVTNVTVAIGARQWLGAAAVALPDDMLVAAGLAATDARGQARVVGPGVKAACLALVVGPQILQLSLRLESSAEGPVVVVEDPAELQQRAAACLAACEAAAVATLKNFASAQAQMRACAANDVNGNGQGEYGFLAQLSGAADVSIGAPGGGTRISPPVLSTVFSRVNGSCVARHGYLFQVFLPSTDGWVTEAPFGGARGVAVDPARAETAWYAVAWPLVAGQTGNRMFSVDQNGKVLATDAAPEKGSGRQHRPAAAAPPK